MSPRHLHKNILRLRTGEPVLPAAMGVLLTFPFKQAVNAALSGPHVALSERVCTDYAVAANDLNHAQAKTHTEGFIPNGPDLAANPGRKHPLGIWMRSDATVYVVDSCNTCVLLATTKGKSGLAKHRAERSSCGVESRDRHTACSRSGEFAPQITMSENKTINTRNGTEHDGGYSAAPAALNIGEVRRVTLDAPGNILTCESDYGFARRVRYKRMISDH